jgi:ADP-ribosylglycohydrolase
MRDKQRGTLFGMAVGDALGAPVEFRPPGSFDPVTDYQDGGPHDLGPGGWTDDTSLALAMAASLKDGWDLNDQAAKYVSWFRNGEYSVNGRCFDIGGTTAGALRTFEETGDARTAASTSEHASGNGSIMRLAPVPIRYAHLFPHKVHQLRMYAIESSLTTHASPQCLSACAYMATVLCGLMHGESREEVLAPDWEHIQGIEWHPDIAEIVQGSFRERKPPEIRGIGYVVKSLEAALWAFHDAEDFSEAVLRAVNLGDDTDTTGAVCGQFAGAFWGESGIPQKWRDNLQKPDMIEEALEGLV